ncbi:MAG: hypothetical protein KAI61_03520 [Alphaproteobacteria bacterium]|nr:hypothetical protein [Alphaproteobacteria bacterium]MCK5658535.1 hypothetical protein [Alphaproteobacteria bacterium]
MKKQILVLAAIGIISLSASTYAQSNNETPPNETYAGNHDDNNQVKPSPNTQTNSHIYNRNKPDTAQDKPKLHTGWDDEDDFDY